MPGPVTSIFKITFDPDGRGLVLLDFGDRLTEEPQFQTQASPQELAPLEYEMGNIYAVGGMLGSVSWEAQKNFTDHTSAALDALARPYLFPWGETKPLDVEIQNSGGTNVIVRYEQSAFAGSSPSWPMAPTGGRIARTFSLTLGGTSYPIQGIDEEAGGYPILWFSTTAIQDLDTTPIEDL